MSNWSLPLGLISVDISDARGGHFRVVVACEGRGPYEKSIAEVRWYSDIAELLCALLRGGGTLVDLGANIGTVCIPVAMAGSKVLAVEMLPQNVAKLLQAGLLNGLRHFRVMQAAVTGTDGVVHWAGDEAWGHISNDAGSAAAIGLRLDTIAEIVDRDSPGFVQGPVAVKLDVEGQELLALQGSWKFLSHHRPAIIFESIIPADSPGPDQIEVKRLVSERLGYAMYLKRGNILAPHKPHDRQGGLISDILALPPEKPQMRDNLIHGGYEFRPLTGDEEVGWLDEMARAEAPHRRHATASIPAMQRAFPDHRELLNAIADRLKGEE
jgi:FkbM family methyltransferase